MFRWSALAHIVRRTILRSTRSKHEGLFRFVLLLVLFIGVFSYTRAGAPARVYAATASTLNFQARVYNASGSTVADGTYSIQFKLYDAASGGSNEWTETQGSLTVKNGYFSAQLGSAVSFPGSIDWSQEKWLTINVNGDGEMNPRIKLTAVPYSFRAGQADSLTNGSGTLSASNIAQLAPSSVQAVNTALAALRINQTGAGLLAQLQGNGSDVFTIAKTGDVVSSGDATFAGGTLNVGDATQSGGLVLSDGSSNTLTLQTNSQSGDLTFTLPSAYGSSGDCLKGNGSGLLSFSGCAGANSFVNGGNAFGGQATLGTTDSNSLRVITANTQAILIDTSGNVRIGSGSPTEKLDVAGGVRVGNSTGTNAGTIRWNGTDFEGYDGTQWVSFTQLGGNTNASTSFVSGLANVGANVTGAAVEMLVFTTATAVSSTAGVTGFTAPADGSFRTCLVKNTANITGGTLNLRWRVNGASVGSGACTMNSTTNRQSATALDPGVVTFSAGDTIGIAFDTVGLAPTTNDFTVYWSVEYETTPSGGVTSTLQDAYDASNTPAMITSSDGKNLVVSLANTTTDANFLVNILSGSTGKFAIQDNGTDAFSVTSSAVTLNKAVTITAGGLNLSSTGITNAGSITGVGANITSTTGLTIASGGGGDLTIDSASNKTVIGSTDTTLQRTAAGSYTIDLSDGSTTTLVLNNSGAGTADLNLSDGGLRTAGTSRLTNAGVLENITGLTVTSGGAVITGNVTLGGSSSDRVTFNGQILGGSPLVFQGATDNGFATTLTFTEPTANNTITFPNASGTLVLDTRTITAGTGLTGGGDLSVNRMLSLDINGLTTTTSINNSDTVAIYDGTGIKKISRSDFLQGLTGALQYQGTWDASTNTPTLSDGTGTAGYIYAVSVSGTQNLGSGNIAFGAGDFVIHNGTIWQRAPSSSSVASVFGRTGAVTSQNGDYTAGQITNTAAGNIAAITVQAALNELDGEKLGSLNGLTAVSQTFANDTNITITSSGSTHTLGWSGQLAVGRGGTGAASFTTNGVIFGNNTGALQVTSAGSGGQVLLANSSGVPTFTSLSGDITIDSSGVTTIGADKVALSGDTTGDFVANLGTLTGLSTTGNSGEGSTPSLSVLYGSSANTAVQGNTTLICPSGTGNLSGTGNTITLGSGGTCNSLNTSNAVTFTTSVTTPIITNAGGLTISATGAGNDIILDSADKIIFSGFDCTSFDNGGVLTVNNAGEVSCDNDDGGGGGSLTGSGTSGRLPVYTGTTSLGNSWLLQDVSTLKLDSGRDFDILGGNLQMAGTTVLDSSRALDNLTGITSTGTITFDSLSAGGLVQADTSGNLSIAVAGTDYEVPLAFNNGLTRSGNTVGIGGSLSSSRDIALGGNNLTFSGSGSLAIGTNTPTAGVEFDLRGELGVFTTGYSFFSSDTTLNSYGYLRSVNSSDSVSRFEFGAYDINGASQGGRDLVLNPLGGNVGIGGDLTPNGLLSVGGTSQFQVSGTGAVIGVGLDNTSGNITNAGSITGVGTNITGTGALTLTSGGSGALTLDSASNTLILADSTLQYSGSGLTIDVANAGLSTLNISNSNGSNLANVDVEGGIFAGNGNAFSVNSDGDLTSVFTALNGTSTANGGSGLGTSTTLILNDASNFDVGNYVQMNSANCGGTGINPCYAKITAKATNTLTISPALRWTTGSTVNEYHVPEIGGTNLTSTLTARYGRGYFIAGVTTGNGTTEYNEDGIVSTLDSFNLLNNGVTTLNIGGAATAINLGSSSTALNFPGSLGGLTGLSVVSGGASIAGNTTVSSGTFSASGGLISLNASSNFGTNINTGTSTGTVTIGGGTAPIVIDSTNFDVSSTGALSGITTLTASGQIYVPGTSGTSAQGFFTGTASTRLGGLQSLDLGGNTYSFFGTNKYYNGSAWVDNGLGRVGSSFQVQNDNFTFYSFDTATNFTARFTVASGGNVGVGGDATPDALFSVGSTSQFQVNTTGGLTAVGVTSAAAGVSLNNNSNFATDINTGTSTGTVTIGGGSAPLVINSSAFDVSSAGALSGITTINASGLVTSVGLTAGAGLIQGTGGLTITGAAVSLNDSSNFAVNIGTGTSTGAVTIGGGSNTFTVASTGIDISANAISNANSLTSVNNTNLTLNANGTGVLVFTGYNCSGNTSNGNLTANASGVVSCDDDNTGISDARLKKNIANLNDDILDRIQSVNTVNFDFDCENEYFTNRTLDCVTARQTGVIAQELAEVFPELVYRNEKDGYYRVKYDALNIYTLKAVTQLAAKVDNASTDTDNNNNGVVTGGVLRLDSAGKLQNITGVSMISGGASVVGGINNNGDGITNTGKLLDVTELQSQTLRLSGRGTDDFLELVKDGEGVFTVFHSGALTLKLDDEQAFNVKNSAGTDIFSVNTAGGLVQIGTETNDTAAALLVLDNVHMEGDPAGVNGAQYYNSTANKFRCFQNGLWRDCLSPVGSDYIVTAQRFNWQQPAADSEIPYAPRTWVDLTDANNFRLLIQVNAAGASNAECQLQFATSDNGPWAPLATSTGSYLSVADTGVQKSNWQAVDPTARQEVLVRAVCRGGDATPSGGTQLSVGSIRFQIN